MVEALLQLAAAPPFAAHVPVQAGQQLPQLPQLPAPVELGNVEQMEEECKVEEQKATDHSTEVTTSTIKHAAFTHNSHGRSAMKTEFHNGHKLPQIGQARKVHKKRLQKSRYSQQKPTDKLKEAAIEIQFRRQKKP